MSGRTPPFWEVKTLAEMTPDEWERLCDRCGRCCLAKIEDEETGELFYTNVACRLFDTERCLCTDYAGRTDLVPDCRRLTPENLAAINWLPATCAYRLLHAGEPLPWWHPLLSGDAETVRLSGMQVSGKVVSERYIHPDQLNEHIIDWVIV